MAEIVNLRLARKTRVRSRKRDEADQNRVLFGRAKAERRVSDAERAKAERDLDARRLSARDPEQPDLSRPDEP